MKKQVMFYKGFHTNSSSSHALVIFKNITNINFKDELDPYCDYGWGNFVITTPKEKLKYILTSLAQDLSAPVIVEDEWVKQMTQKYKFTKDDWKCALNGRIDGQSYPGFNLDKDKDFMTAIIESPHIIIVGGNDNSEVMFCDTFKGENTYVYDMDSIARLGKDDVMKELSAVDSNVSSYDTETYNNKAIFDKRKYYDVVFIPQEKCIRLFSDRINSIDELYNLAKKDGKTDVPIFVDLNYSSKCDFKCPFCYQETNGYVYCSGEGIFNFLILLDSIGVKQVALGGGKTDSLPFTELWKNALVPYLEKFKNNEANMVLNYTTRDINDIYYLLNQDKTLTKHIGIGFSIDKPQDIIMINSIPGIEALNITFHIIPEMWPNVYISQLIDFMKEYECFNYLLLGYKTTKNEAYKAYYEKIVDNFNAMSLIEAIIDLNKEKPYVQVDTVFLKTYRKHLEQLAKERDVSINNMWVHEGLISKYIDLTTFCVYKSSYEKDVAIEIDINDAESVRKALMTFFG